MTTNDVQRSTPRIGAIGLASWDRLHVVDAYPAAGEWTEVTAEHEGPGGTTGNTVTALARLGARVAFRAVVGDDADGTALRAALDAAGVDATWVTVRAGEPTDAATIVVSGNPPDRTIFWRKGARIARGDQIDIAALFGHDLVFVDVDDPWLYRFLVDLPVHTLPTARLLGSLAYLDCGVPGALEIAIRADAIVGNLAELLTLTDARDLDTAIAAVRGRMRFENLRAAIISLGAAGAVAFTETERWHAPAVPVRAVDTTGAGDAFAAGVAFGMACRWNWPATLRLANAVAAHAVTGLGAQTRLPTWDEAMAMLARAPEPSG
jgi:sugar/nucleoside kinase (ribokinase family)